MADLFRYLRKPVVLLSFVVVLLGQLYLNTYGTWTLIEKEFGGGAYDALADSLMRGDTAVPLNEIYSEGIRSGGKISMYFGPFPAFPRIIAHLLTPQLWGKWSRLAELSAATLALISFLMLWFRVAGRFVPDVQRASWLGCLMLGFGLGSPVLFLVSCSYIYHEAITWGLAWSLFALAAAAALEAERPHYSPKNLALFGTGAGLAFLSRVTFGAPLFFLAAVFAIDAVISERARAKKTSRRPALRHLLAATPCALPVLVCLLFHLWYNHARFGSPFIFGAARHVYPDPHTIQVVERFGTFNVQRIPTALQNYFTLPRQSILSEPPFFQLAMPRILTPELYPYRLQRDAIGTLFLTAPWLLLGSFLGLYSFFVRRRPMFLFIVAALTGEVLLVCAVRHLSHRFTAEILPLLAYLFSHGVSVLFDPSVSHLLRRTFIGVLLAAGVLSIGANFGTTLSWNAWDNWAAPERWRKLLTDNYVLASPPRKPAATSEAAPP